MIWNTRCQEAFAVIKRLLSETPTLHLPSDSDQLVLDVDASDSGLGAVLSAETSEGDKPIAYSSRMLSDAEKRYCITRREMLAVIFGLQKYRQHLLGRSFVLRTDHAPILSILHNKNPSSLMCRWIDFFQEFNFNIQHRPGTRHQNADGLSRSASLCAQCHISAEDYDSYDCGYIASSTPVTNTHTETVCRITRHAPASHLTLS